MKKTAKFGLAAVSAALLAFGASATAHAADVQIGPDLVAGFEVGGVGTEAGFNYNTWHVGSVSALGTPVTESLTFGECNVTVLAPPTSSSQTTTQVLKGFDPTARVTTANTGDVSEIQALIDSISIDVASGSVTVQLPMFAYYGGDTSAAPSYFTTLRNSDAFGPGVHTLSAGTVMADSGGAYTGDTLSDVLGDFTYDIDGFDDVIEILGVGFTGSPDTVVNSISFAGNTYYFGTGSCLPAAPTPPTSVQTAAAGAADVAVEVSAK